MGIKQELFSLARAYDRVRGVPPGFIYSCCEELVLKNGTVFKDYHRKLPPGISAGKKRLCFQNAFELAWNPEYRYCEGYGLIEGLFPMHHAWNVDRDGIVVDRTWDTSENIEYMGLIFDHRWVSRYVLRKNSYGILDYWQKEFPELQQGWEGLQNIEQTEVVLTKTG